LWQNDCTFCHSFFFYLFDAISPFQKKNEWCFMANFDKIKVKKSISLERECSVNMRTFKNRKIKVKNFLALS
jgi:hypothetical protein